MESNGKVTDNDAFARHCGVEITDIGDGTAKGRLEVKSHHLNGVKITHGAAIFTLADTVFAAASNSHGHVAVAVNVNISYLKATEAGDILYAEAKENNPRGRIGSYTITVTDQSGETIALFEGLAYRKF